MNMTGKTKVLSVAHSAATTSSGRTRYELISRLHQDIDLLLVVPSRWHEYGREKSINPPEDTPYLQIEPARLRSLPWVKWYLHYYPGLRDILLQFRPDVIHLWEEPWSFVAWHAAWLRDRLTPNAALIIETEQNILRQLPPPFEQIRRKTLRQTDFLIGRQHDSIGVARACGFDGPASVVEYGVDTTIFKPEDPDGARKGRPHTLGLVLGYVGRIVPEKGLNDVLAAIQLSGRDISFWVLGDGPDRDQIIRRAGELGLADRTKIFGPRRQPEVALFMNALDVLVLMSRTTRTWKEQFGRVIIEANACGVPVIGSDSGSIPGVVANGGWIVREGDVSALAALLRRIDDNRAEVVRAGEAGLSQARRRFSIQTVAADLASAFIQARSVRSARSVSTASAGQAEYPNGRDKQRECFWDAKS